MQVVLVWVWDSFLWFLGKMGKVAISYMALTLFIDGSMVYVLKYLQPFLNVFSEPWHLIGGDTCFLIWIAGVKFKLILKYSGFFVK